MADLNHQEVQKILQSTGFAHLATLGPNGEPQSSPMWFMWDGEHLKFTHMPNRKKYQNIKRDPRVSVSITDVDNPYSYAEFRGVVTRIEDDLQGQFFDTLAERYGSPLRHTGEPRVILYVQVQRVAAVVQGGYTQVLVAQPELNVYQAFGSLAEQQKGGISVVQEVKTAEALTLVFKTSSPLSANLVEDIRQTSGVLSITANLDGKPQESGIGQ
ncbi:PPOX class F420-dependent oxidoreductase [Ktedonosporobacter rubrisoli]|uniref:PPOX class F420-dependent oxidoreductase n=1 Tax=Ktedonosporobacter rubrisoli TaxID=2509675 RepID=A0A4P6JVT8_KTERU|nr:PPOX class F420-dependent oxidoreductase [Ktedonosporobacter rubrisoli]QBD79654.1 PPOX class F420-dependent oxidoreductase [Ktedonosporobacter rubrisoli]